MKNLDTQLCKAKSIRNGQWVYGYCGEISLPPEKVV